MKAHYRTANGRITFEIEGGSQKELFEGISLLQEVFEADSTCGVCNSPEIRFRVRKVDTYVYYEYHCKCGARLSFGQSKDMKSLFPKRKDDSGWLPDRGWSKYQPKGDAYEN